LYTNGFDRWFCTHTKPGRTNIRSWRTGLPIAEDIMLTPRQFEDCYHNLDVILDDFETTTVDVYRYRNNDPKYNTDAYKETNTVEAMKQKERLLGLMDAEIRKLRKIQLTKPKVEWKPRRQDASLQLDTSFLGSPAVFTQVLTQHTVSAATYSEVSRQAGLFPGLLGSLAMAEVLQRLRPVMMKVHAGKGSPEEIAVALHLVAKYKMYDKKFHDDLAQGVQDYCTRYIGLDCNGFVGNYAQAIGLSKRPSTDISTFSPPGARRSELGDVRANDVIVWPNYSHITIIDSVDKVTTGPDGKQSRDCRVVEASASNVSKETKAANGALQNSVYTLRATGSKAFNAERPKGSGAINRIYITPLA
jgi:hypothetical protein